MNMDMDKELELFLHIPSSITSQLQQIAVKKGTVFIEASAQKEVEFYYILDGQVSVFAQAPNGREYWVDTQGRGDFMGKFSQFRGQNFNCEVRADTDCRLLVLTPFKQELLRNSRFALWFYLKTSGRVYEMYKIAIARSLFSFDELLSYHLLRLEKNGCVNVSLKNMLNILNISERQYFYLVKNFEKRGLLHRRRCGFDLLDRPALAGLASNVTLFMNN